MKVFLFGAGASKAAGYPLTSGLMTELETKVRSMAFSRPWQKWKCLSDSLSRRQGRWAFVMSRKNPEVFLSLLDLYEEARKETGSAPRPSGQLKARGALLECLRSYFEKKHEESCKQPPPRYLKEKLAELKKGDVVITLNWDTMVERSLLASKSWAPTDGYGFRKKLFLGTSQSDKKPLNPVPKSQICVLKLHGSVGWYSKNQHVHFDRKFLSAFPFPWEDGPRCFDPQQPNDVRSYAVMAYPTYLKKLADQEMQQVWHSAANALRKAHMVEVWGYSLPESDAAIRILLNAARFRTKVQICVHERCEAARKRWCEFLRGSKGQFCIDGKELGGTLKCPHEDHTAGRNAYPSSGR
jgi:hypothetical protein